MCKLSNIAVYVCDTLKLFICVTTEHVVRMQVMSVVYAHNFMLLPMHVL